MSKEARQILPETALEAGVPPDSFTREIDDLSPYREDTDQWIDDSDLEQQTGSFLERSQDEVVIYQQWELIYD